VRNVVLDPTPGGEVVDDARSGHDTVTSLSAERLAHAGAA
jgi:hypothetical protein